MSIHKTLTLPARQSVCFKTHRCSQGLVITISIIGRFDVSTYSEVSRAFTLYSYQNPRYVIDMSKTGRVHDFGIGMLLLLRERLGERRIEIIGCRRDIQQKLIYFGLEGLLKATNGSHAA